MPTSPTPTPRYKLSEDSGYLSPSSLPPAISERRESKYSMSSESAGRKISLATDFGNMTMSDVIEEEGEEGSEREQGSEKEQGSEREEGSERDERDERDDKEDESDEDYNDQRESATYDITDIYIADEEGMLFVSLNVIYCIHLHHTNHSFHSTNTL